MPPSTRPAALLSVSPGTAEPIYKQLIDQVKRLVASGQLAAGDELPSVRELAHTLAINPMTVSKAYSQLESQGLLERRRGLGMVVAAEHSSPTHHTDRLSGLRPTLERAALEAAQLEVSNTAALKLFENILKGKR
jgi:GntR family transcriptional regulator